MGKVHYPIEQQVDDCYKYLGMERKSAYDMTEDEISAAEREREQYFKWVEHPKCAQMVPQHIESGKILF